MQYKTNSNRRSRLAEAGAGSLTQSLVRTQPRSTNNPQLPYDLDPDFEQMPHYSAFRSRKRGDPLKDFQIEIEDRSTRNDYIKHRRRTEKALEEDMMSNRSIEKSLVDNRAELKCQLSQLKVMMAKLSAKREIDDDYLERKIREMMPPKQKEREKETSHKFYPPPPQYIPIPMYPPPMQYSQSPYPPSPYPSQYQSVQSQPPQEVAATPKSSVKPKPNLRKRLKKAFISVAFPFLLKAYSKKLVSMRKEQFAKNLEEYLEVSTLGIRNWFLETSNKAISILLDKRDVSMDFRAETDEMVLEEKLKLFAETMDSLTNGLLNNSKSELINEYLDFLLLTCADRSFMPQSFLTEREMSYLSVDEDQSFIRMTKSLQEAQLLVFVFIKMLTYNLLLQPWKFDESLNTTEITTNMMLMGSVVYHCTCELIEKRLADKQPPYFKKGNMLDQYEYATFIYNEAENDPNQFISGLPSRLQLKKIVQHAGGKCWKFTRDRIEKVMGKVYQQLAAKRKHWHKELLELEAHG